jgi:hypothetical protein
MVLLVQKAILMSACLNKLVMNVVSFPIHVNMAHLCVGVWIVSVLSVSDGVVFVVLLGRNCCVECSGWCLLLVGIHLLAVVCVQSVI